MANRLRLILVFLTALLAASGFADREHQLKAAFIYNFAKFIDWPESSLGAAGAPFTIGIYRAEAYRHDLEATLGGKSISGHPITIQSIYSDDSLGNCRMAVIGDATAERIAHMARLCHGTGTILIGDTDQFAKDGGMIGFLIESNRIRFDVNLATARESGVSISSKLLSLARAVYR